MGINADPDTCRHRDFVGPQLDRLRQRCGYPASDVGRVLAAADLRQDEHELVTAETGNRALLVGWRQTTRLAFLKDRIAPSDAADQTSRHPTVQMLRKQCLTP